MRVFLQGSEVLSQDGTLSIQDVSYDKAGEYMCVAAVPSVPGLTAEARVNLTIKGNTLAQTCSLYTHTHTHSEIYMHRLQEDTT